MIEFGLFVLGALVCGGVGWGGCALHYRQLWRYTVADLDADGEAAEGAENWLPPDEEDDDPATSQWARDLIAEVESWSRMELASTTGRQP
jgi:hypothetical protein